jgi:threonine dehydrogenase-like Zn-dependent dehydrogenase
VKAVILWEPERLETVDLSLRPLRRGEVLLQVKACSICGSDLEGYHGYHPKMTYPRVMGHEVASVVAEVGPGVTTLSVGDRVAGTGGVTCGECPACVAGEADRCTAPLSPGFTAHGAYAEYVIGRADGCTPVPEGVSYAEAAVAQPAGIARHAVATRADVQPSEKILIQGCGPIGLSALRLAKLRGATVISTDIVDYRIDAAQEWGADHAFNDHRKDVRAEIAELTQGRGVDKVIECVGSDQDETIPEAVECVKAGGLVVVVGSFAANRATLPIIDFKFGEKTIAGSQGMPEGYAPVFERILSGELPVEQLISHRLPLEQAEHGLNLMDTKAEQVLKVVLEP